MKTMNYSIYNKNEIIQTYNLRYRNNIEPIETPLGKILSELINFDYDEFFEYYNSLNDKKKRNYGNIKIKGICKETEAVLIQLLLPAFYIRKNPHITSVINKLVDDIKDLIKSNNLDYQFIEFYFNRIYNIKVSRKQFPIEMYSSAPIAPVLSKYSFNNEELLELFSKCNGNVPRKSNEQRLEAYNNLLNYLQSELSDIHYSICKKFSLKGLMASTGFRLNNLEGFNFTNDEKYEYIKLVYEYEQGKNYVVNSLPEFLIISFIHCCKENIRIEKCYECGNIYFKYRKNKYCSETCKIKARKKQESKRIYKYISGNGEVFELNYNTVIKNFEQKIQRLIDFVNNKENVEFSNITDKSKKEIINELVYAERLPRSKREDYEKLIKNIQNDKERQIAETELAKWLYKIRCFHKKKNSLLNEYKEAVQNQSEFTIKVPIFTDDFKVDYKAIKIPSPKYK